MVLAQMVVEAVILEGRSVRDVARSYGVSKSRVSRLVARYRAGGLEGLEPQSRRPHHSPGRTPLEVEDEIVALRKELLELGGDAGADTIQFHLASRRGSAPSISTVHRILVRRGFVTPEPNKRPKASYVRFQADQPNEMWQADVTHWTLGNGVDVEILTFLDDHSRMVVACDARFTTRATDVVTTFEKACAAYGPPASVLTDNAAIFSARYRKGRNAFELCLSTWGVLYKNSRPYHPQTCGKVERWHATLKQFLAARPTASSIRTLQRQLDAIVRYYNEERPHKVVGRRPPRTAYLARDRAVPGLLVPTHYRIREDKVDRFGKVSLRHGDKMRHLGIGRAFAGMRVTLYVAGDHVRVVSEQGELLGQCEIDATRGYQPLNKTI